MIARVMCLRFPGSQPHRSGLDAVHHQLGRSVGWQLGQPGRTSIRESAEVVTVTDRFRPLFIALCGPYVAQAPGGLTITISLGISLSMISLIRS
jgi:hypothetical protein